MRAPGDKSISHRALILGALASGRTEITGLLEGEDVLATARAAATFGAGRGGLQPPTGEIDCGNSGTGVRLLIGAAAAYPIKARFTGDASLSKRPMNRVIEPLSLMGADFDAAEGGSITPKSLITHCKAEVSLARSKLVGWRERPTRKPRSSTAALAGRSARPRRS